MGHLEQETSHRFNTLLNVINVQGDTNACLMKIFSQFFFKEKFKKLFYFILFLTWELHVQSLHNILWIGEKYEHAESFRLYGK